MNKLILFTSVFLLMLFISPVLATTTITTCQDLNSEDTYELGNDLVFNLSNNINSYCLGLNSANITVDCKGHRIFDSDYSTDLTSISDATGSLNIELRNCILEGGHVGFSKAGGAAYIHDVTIKKMSGVGLSIYTGSYNLTNINFTQMYGRYTYPWEGGGGSCDYNYTNIKDIDTGLPLEYYNTPVSISNRELAELTLCQSYNSNLTNITIRQNYIAPWWDETPNPLARTSGGTWLYSAGSDNLTITDSKFINIYQVNLFNSGGGYNFHTNIVNSNVTNWFNAPFYGLFSGGNSVLSVCEYYNFTNVYVDGYPFVYGHGGVAVNISNGTYGGISLCNAPDSTITDVYTDWLGIHQGSTDVVVDRLYTNTTDKYRNIQIYGYSCSDTSANITNSVLWNYLYSVFVRQACANLINNSIGSYLVDDVNTYAPLYERYSTTVRHYNNIISRGSSSNFYLWDGQSATAYWDDGVGTGNYYTNSTNNDFSDTCIDTTPADGICDSTFNPLQIGTDNYPLSVKPTLNLLSPPPCSEGTYQCDGSDRQVCSSGNWTFVETCAFGCNLGSCIEEEEELGIFGQTIADVGSGIGGFFTAIANPLAYILLILGITAGITAIFMGVVFIIRKAIK